MKKVLFMKNELIYGDVLIVLLILLVNSFDVFIIDLLYVSGGMYVFVC